MTDKPEQKWVTPRKADTPPQEPVFVTVRKAPDEARVGRSKWDRSAGAKPESTVVTLWAQAESGISVSVVEEDADSQGKRRKRRVHVLGRALTAEQAANLSALLAEAAEQATRKRRA